MANSYDVVVVGAGVIGLSAAWRLAVEGHSVALVDPDPRRAATQVAAGMLAPVTEAHYTEPALLRLMLDSARRWPMFAAAVSDASGRDPAYVQCGTLAVAFDADDREELDRLHAFLTAQGLGAERLGSTDCRAAEPLLAPGIRGGLLVAGDHQVDPRRLSSALRTAAEGSGVAQHAVSAVSVDLTGACVTVALDDGSSLAAQHVVLAAGAWSPRLAGLPPDAVPPVRPVRGEVLRLQGPPGLLRRPVRGLVNGTQVYVVPRADGEVVLGATSEERGFDVTVTAEGVYTLLRDARAVLPALADLAVTEITAGLRPVSPDNAPIVAAVGTTGLVLATGHGRHGVLLAPVTAEAVTALVRGEDVPESVADFGLDRFQRAPA